MAKRRGRKQIEKWIDEVTGVEIRMFLITKDMSWEINVLGRRLYGTDGEKLKKDAAKLALSLSTMEFKPVIVVIESKPYSGRRSRCAFVGFSLERIYVAKRGDSSWVQLEYAWYLEHKEDTDTTRFIRRARSFRWDCSNLPFTEVSTDFHNSGQTTILDYSDELWAGLCALQAAIKKVRETLLELVSSCEGIARLIEVGAGIENLLPAEAGVFNE